MTTRERESILFRYACGRKGNNDDIIGATMCVHVDKYANFYLIWIYFLRYYKFFIRWLADVARAVGARARSLLASHLLPDKISFLAYLNFGSAVDFTQTTHIHNLQILSLLFRGRSFFSYVLFNNLFSFFSLKLSLVQFFCVVMRCIYDEKKQKNNIIWSFKSICININFKNNN